MRNRPDSHTDCGPQRARSSDPHNPMPWELTSLFDTVDGSTWNPTEADRATELRSGSGSNAHRDPESDRPITPTQSTTDEPPLTGRSSHWSSTMSRIKSIIGQGSTALGLVIVVGATFGPSTVVRRAEEVAFASWRALGDQLANHELSAISEQLDRERQDAETIGALAGRPLGAIAVARDTSRARRRRISEIAALDSRAMAIMNWLALTPRLSW